MPTNRRKLQETALFVERVVAVFMFVALLVGVGLVLRPFATAILFGGIIVIATWPIHEWLLRRGLSNAAAALILSIIAGAIIVVPAIILAPRLGGQLVQVVSQAQAFLNDAPELPSWVAQLPLIGPKTEQLWSRVVHGQVQEILSPYSATLRKTAFDIGTALAEGMLQIVLSLAVAAMFWLRGDVIRSVLENIASRFAGSFGEKALHAAASSVKGVAYGIVGTAIVQAVALTIGLFVAGIPNAGVLGFLALLIALSQIGILLTVIWGGAAWWLFSAGAQWWAIFMIVWGLFVSLVDNVVRPLLVGFGATIPLTLVFIGVLGGFVAFGFLGMFIGPTLLAVFLALLQAWREPAKSDR
jgi:predicted PurR-regulated permease PerM